MKKRVVILFISFVFVTISMVAAFLVLKNRKTIEIRLGINDKTERWVYRLDNSSILKFNDVKTTDNENIFTFKTQTYGKATVIFEKYLGSEVEAMEIKKYVVTIDKERNVKLDEYEVDNTFEIVQTKNSGVEYKWIYSIQDENIVKLEDITEKAETDEIIDGATLDVKYKFKALTTGETTITFKYVSLDEKEVDEEINYKVKIDKKMKITVREEKKR